MFYKVMKTYLQFLVIYIFFIVAFGLAFFIMLHKDNGFKNNVNNATTNETSKLSELNSKEDYIYFDTPWLALVKTLTMFVGELQFEDIPIFDVYSNSSLRLLAHLFFLCFVFLIVIVLVNLLNGLAVSNVAKIEAEAEYWIHSSRLEVILQIESIFLNYKEEESIFQQQNKRSCFGNWIRGNFVQPNLSFCALLQIFGVFKTILNGQARRVLIFNNILKNGKYDIYPNEEQSRFGFFYLSTMDSNIITEAKKIISEKQIKEQIMIDQDNSKNIIDKLQKDVTNLGDKVENMERLLICINDKISKLKSDS